MGNAVTLTTEEREILSNLKTVTRCGMCSEEFIPDDTESTFCRSCLDLCEWSAWWPEFKSYFWRKQNERCYYCGNPLRLSKYHVDHKQPKSRGGSCHPSNLCLACQHCNCSKGMLTESEFKEWKGF